MFSKRLKQFIDYQHLSVRSFEEETSITQGIASRTIKNNLVLSGENLIKLAKRWPYLNVEWLLTGEGNMIKSEENQCIELLKKANIEVLYWKDLVNTLNLAIKENHEIHNKSNTVKSLTVESAIKVLSHYKSKGSDHQKISYEIHERYLGICKLIKRGIREPAIILSKKLLESAVFYQEYTIATELSKNVVNHHAIFGDKKTALEYMQLFEKYNAMAEHEFRTRQIFNKVYYNHEHLQETNKEEIENEFKEIQFKMPLESLNFHFHYYKCKCILSEGKEVLKWAYEAITYFENQNFIYQSAIKQFNSMVINYYIDNGLIEKAFSILHTALEETSTGSYAWFLYMYSKIELLAKEGRIKDAANNFEIATNHEVFSSLAEGDRQHWEILRQMIYDDESVKEGVKV